MRVGSVAEAVKFCVKYSHHVDGGVADDGWWFVMPTARGANAQNPDLQDIVTSRVVMLQGGYVKKLLRR